MGYPHPRYLSRALTSRDWSEWLAYFALEPFGPERDDHRAASIVQIITNTNRDPKKHQAAELSDAKLLTPYERTEQQRAKKHGENLLAKVAAINAALNGKDNRK